MPTASLKSRGYLPVATASLLPAAVLNCDLYIQRPGRPFAELYRGASCPFWNADLNQLREDGVDHLYVRSEDAEAYRDYLCQHVLHDRNIPQQARMRALREVTRVTFQDALDANDCGQMVGVATAFGDDLASNGVGAEHRLSRAVLDARARLLHVHACLQRQHVLRDARPPPGNLRRQAPCPNWRPGRCCTTLASGTFRRTC